LLGDKGPTGKGLSFGGGVVNKPAEPVHMRLLEIEVVPPAN
jgi:hypothetical protein